MSAREPMSPELRRRVLDGLEPVSPLAPPARRAMALALTALAAVGLAGFWLARGRGAAPLVSLAGGGFSLLEWAAGLLLVWMALREAVPGLGFGAARAAGAVAAAIALELALGLALAEPAPGAGTGLAQGARCGAVEGALGLPLLAAAAFLLLRGLPVRPRWSGALAGTAAGLFADAVWHLSCSSTDLAHLLVWHLGATLLLAALGFLGGSWWIRRGAGAR